MKIQIERRGDIRHVIVANHAKLNTLGSPLLEELARAFEVEEDIRAVVLTGEGERAFIGGADIKEMGAVTTPAGGEAFIRRVHGACAAIRACRVPVIARIQGWCLGAGLEIAAACDLRIAATAAKFGMPEVRVGIPSVVEAALLPGLIGWAGRGACSCWRRRSTRMRRNAGASWSASCRWRNWTRPWRNGSTCSARRGPSPSRTRRR